MTYKAFVILVDTDYPMPTEPEPWEGGWWPVEGYEWPNEDLDNAEWFAGFLANTGTIFVTGGEA